MEIDNDSFREVFKTAKADWNAKADQYNQLGALSADEKWDCIVHAVKQHFIVGCDGYDADSGFYFEKK